MATTLVSVAALVVSLVVTLVQYAQWRTANQKVVIDLYDRRLQVYRQLEKAIAPVMREAEVDQAAFTAFCIGESDATFLFGDDIRQYLKSLRKALAWMLSFKDDAIDRRPDREQLIDTKFKYLAEINSFYDEAPKLFAPYIKLTQKNTPFWRPW